MVDWTRAHSVPAALPYVAALRPHQWLKNILVFVPMLASHRVSPETLYRSLLAFVAFSLIASSVYIINDLIDLEADRAHPRKRYRPFASAAIAPKTGLVMAAGLAFLALLLSSLAGGFFTLSLMLYFAISTAYSLSLKRRLMLDICTLASLYTLRIVAGALATGIPTTVWLLAFSIFFFLALAAVKRQAELIDRKACGEQAARGRGYVVADLPIIGGMAISAGFVSVLVMALYLTSPGVAEVYRNPPALWGVCLVLLYWISHIVMTTHRGLMHDDPLVFAIRDRTSQFCLVLAGCFLAGATFL